MSQSTAYPAATAPFVYQGDTFTPEQLAILAGAIDAGLFYNRAVEAHCEPAWRALHPCSTRAITGAPDAPWDTFAGNGTPWLQQREALTARLRELPRGAYALLVRDCGEYRFWYALIHDGSGGISEPSLGHSPAPPSAEYLVDYMVRMEIYSASLAEKERRSVLDAQRIVSERGLAVGRTLRDVHVAGRQYSSAVITSICPRGAYVSLLLTKRGSRKRWQWSGWAQNIGLPGQPAAVGLPLVVDTQGRTLFSEAA